MKKGVRRQLVAFAVAVIVWTLTYPEVKNER
jgi:hypothetical protein